MSIISRTILLLQTEMERPKPYGWFHIFFILIMLLTIFILYRKRNYTEKKLKVVLAFYGITSLLLEILKQISWAFTYDSIKNLLNNREIIEKYKANVMEYSYSEKNKIIIDEVNKLLEIN